jgi:cobalt/nickel transport system permease protein
MILGSLFWLRNIRKADNRLITIAALCTAAAFAVFQVNIPLFGGVHLNLTPLVGILAGPVSGSIIVLIVNIFSAAIGHGGWGLIGANTLINISEVFVAYFLYIGLKRFGLDPFSRSGIATLIGLLTGNLVMIGIIMISGIQGVTQDPMNIFYGLSLVAGVNMGIAILEALITGYIVAYIHKIRPDMLGESRNATE